MDAGNINGQGQATIAITGTAVQLPVASFFNGILITAKSTNANPICLGDSSVNNKADGTGKGYIIEAGQSVYSSKKNLSDLYINGTAGDIVSFCGA